jgi:signal transduction histidine kinase/ActR/RegA family two-component response regulator
MEKKIDYITINIKKELEKILWKANKDYILGEGTINNIIKDITTSLRNLFFNDKIKIISLLTSDDENMILDNSNNIVLPLKYKRITGYLILVDMKNELDISLNVFDDFTVLLSSLMEMANSNNKTNFLKGYDYVDDKIIITDLKLYILQNNYSKTNTKNYIYDIFPETKQISTQKNDCKIETNNKSIHVKYIEDNNYEPYYIFKIIDTNNEDTKNKNLIAYLSHELRNPIQAISTGVYIINRTLEDTMNHNKNYRKRSDSPDTLNSLCIDNKISDSSDTYTTIDEKIYNINHETNLLDSDHIYDDYSKKYFFNETKKTYTKSEDEVYETIKLKNYDSDEHPMVSMNRISSDNNLSESYISTSNDSIGEKTSKNKVLKNIIKRIDNSCNNLNIIINDILDLSKIDNNEMMLNIDECNLNDIIETIYEEFEETIDNKGLKLEIIYDSKLPEDICTDETRLYQILSNLISNSIKYSQSGTISLKIVYDENSKIKFIVKDEGIGIKENEMKNLFKTYGRTSDSIYNNKSNGLGLCVCQKLAKLLGGNIEVSSVYNKGSTFVFTHPIKINNSINNNNSKVENIIKPKINISNYRANILIVDDDKNITHLFKLLLKWFNFDNGCDFNIDIANTGNKALDYSNNKSYDLIFMDIDLDGEDGILLCDSIKTNSFMSNHSKIIAITANIKYNINNERMHNFTDFILKPFTDKTIIKCLNNHLI